MNIPECLMAEEIKTAILEDEHLSALAEPLVHNWP